MNLITGKIDPDWKGHKINMVVEYEGSGDVIGPNTLEDNLEFEFEIDGKLGWGEEVTVYLYHEDENGRIDYINEYVYNGIGELGPDSHTGFLVAGYMFLQPAHENMHIYKQLPADYAMEHLERALSRKE